MSKYEIYNVNCKNCVNKIQSNLKEDFGDLNFSDDLGFIFSDAEEEELRYALDNLGFKLGNKII